MKPLVAVVGRPNVGKSTFFNRMIGERVAVVEDLPGTTRDRIYGDADWNGREFTLIDTGGLELGSDIPVGQVGLTGQPGDIMKHVKAQAELAIEEADVIVFMVDARSGITAADEEVADLLRRTEKPVILAANKADNAARRLDAVEFYSLGLGEPIVISSIQGSGTGDLLDVIVEALPPEDEETEDEDDEDVSRIAIVGRPNVGKSSLLNAILGSERAIVSEVRPWSVGDDMHLMADFNQGLNLGEALQRCHMIDDLGLDWIEEPIVYDNFDGYAQLAAELKTPIQIGENFYGPRDLQRALQMKACDYVMPDFMRIGGVTGWLRAASIAGTAGVPMSTHLYPEVAAHVMRVTETAHWLEWQDWADPILQKPYEIKDSLLHIPDVPGTGLEWNEDAVAAHRADG